jgi:hypothetical protein
MKRQKNDKHLDFVRGLPCLVCGDPLRSEAAHVRYADRRAAKRMTGMGEKPSDVWAVPLCDTHHRLQHQGNERKFWEGVGADPIFICLALNLVSGDNEAGEQIISSAQTTG